MAFCSTSSLPHFHNFNDAVEFYKNVKGIRGRTHLKPLKSDRRNPDAYWITADVDGDGNIRAVQCNLYRTPVLVYTPDHLIINAYDSRTTNDFINAISPRWLHAYMEGGQRFGIRGEGVFLGDLNDKLVIPVDANYQPKHGEVQAANLEAIVLNRTRASEARKTCKEVVALAVTTSKLDGYWEALRESPETPDDDTMRWLKGVLMVGNYRVSASKCFHYGFADIGVGSQEGLIPALKQWLYKREYVNQGCYDYIPAEYGVIPNQYRSV